MRKFDFRKFNEEEDYFPLYEGLKPSSMGLGKMNGKKHFLINPESFQMFRENKLECRAEGLSSYYQKTEEVPSEIILFIIKTLNNEYPDYFQLIEDGHYTLKCQLTHEELEFSKEGVLLKSNSQYDYIDAFDALSMQIPEDLVVHKVPKNQLNPLVSNEEKKDYAQAIHLCNCNGWDAEWAIGESFDFIHQGVPRINKIIPNATRMMLSFFRNIEFERIAAISFKTSPLINRHEKHSEKWVVPFDSENPAMHIRVERQTVKGFSDCEAFLFTIRTFAYDMNFKENPYNFKKRIEAIENVFSHPDAKSYAYDVIKKYQGNVLDWLAKQRVNLNLPS